MSERIKLWERNLKAAFVILLSLGAFLWLFFLMNHRLNNFRGSKKVYFNDFETFDVIEDFSNIGDIGAGVRKR